MAYTADFFDSSMAGDSCRDDFNVMEDNCEELRKNFHADTYSGSGNPTLLLGQIFSRDTDNMLYIQHETNDQCVIMKGSEAARLYSYRNDTDDGWLIDPDITDCVLAIKGGSNAYNTTGGNLAGSWTQSSHSHNASGDGNALTLASHNHQWYNFIARGTTSQIYNSSGTLTNLSCAVSSCLSQRYCTYQNGSDVFSSDAYSSNAAPGLTGATAAATEATTTRPYAAVGTIQWMDLIHDSSSGHP